MTATTAADRPTEEEIRAYEEQLSRIGSIEIVLQAAASLISIGGHRLGLAAGKEAERDLDQVRDAIDAVRALLPIAERRVGAEQTRPLRDALSQLQMAYAQLVGAAGGGQAADPAGAAAPQEPSSAGASQPPAGASRPGSGASQPPGGASERAGGQPPAPAPDSEEPAGGQRKPGPAESSGRLWVPGR